MILLSLTSFSVNLSLDLGYHFLKHFENSLFSLFPCLLFLFNCNLDSPHLLFSLFSDYKITLFPLLLLVFNHFLYFGKVILETSL